MDDMNERVPDIQKKGPGGADGPAAERRRQAGAPGNTRWYFFVLYLAIAGSFYGLELDSFVSDLPYSQVSTLLLFLNVIWIMLLPPYLYVLFANRGTRAGILILNTVYLHIAAFLALYKATRKIDFDFRFLWYNTADALPVVWKMYAPWLFVLLFSMTAFVFLQKPAFAPVMAFLQKSPRRRKWILPGLLASSFLCQLTTISTIRGSATGFVYASFLSDRRLRSDYNEFYRKHIDLLRSETPRAVSEGHPSIMGDIIFFIKQESLNGILAQPRITPQLLHAAKDGIFFKSFYANSVQSLRGYECILCGVPPNLAGALVDEYTPTQLRDLRCLPHLFRSLGYHPLYFFGGSRNARIVRFAESIGFEKVLADEIMRQDDAKFDWGYREDVFYSRVFEHLQRYHAKDKLFVFIDTGSTNHTPFEVLDDRFLDSVPFPQPEKFEEHLANTTFVQDAYLGNFFELFNKYYRSLGTVIVVSDHAWPMSIHKNNIYNERGAYEENFRIPLLFVPPSSEKEHFATGMVVTQRYSQMDIFPTILSLIGLEQKHLLGESFAPWLLASQSNQRLDPSRPKISLQPYGGGYISAVRYPEKYLYDLLGKTYKVFDLEKDPNEESPSVHPVGDHNPLIREFFYPESTTLPKK